MIKTLSSEFTEKYKVVLVRRHSCYQLVWMISNNHIDKIPFTFMMAFQSSFFSFILIRCDNNVCKLLLFHDGTSISVVIHCGKTYFQQFISNLQYFNADYLECFTTEIANVWQVCLINLGKYTYESIVKFCS